MQISNDKISISVRNKGAELTSIKVLESNKEFLWQADPNFWGKHAPILFPVIGTMKDGEYEYNGKTYQMTKHGFARDLDFEFVSETKDTLKYVLKANDYTLKMYPFEFELYVMYKLENNKIIVTYEVFNMKDEDMYFSIGGHPAFNCDIEGGNAYLQFEKEENFISKIVDGKNGLVSPNTIKIKNNKNQIHLSYDLFNNDALILENLNSNSIIIKNTKTNDSVKMTHTGFPYMGIWTKPAPFICLEPWYGIADYYNTNKKLEDKIGIRKLKGNESFACSYSIELNC